MTEQEQTMKEFNQDRHCICTEKDDVIIYLALERLTEPEEVFDFLFSNGFEVTLYGIERWRYEYEMKSSCYSLHDDNVYHVLAKLQRVFKLR